MKNLYYKALSFLRMRYLASHKKLATEYINIIQDPERVYGAISERLTDNKPVMIARFGANELQAMLPFVPDSSHSPLKYIKGDTHAWWVSEGLKSRMRNNAGFFPSTTENINKFAQLMLNDMKEVDILGAWQPEERFILPLMNDPLTVRLRLLEPFWGKVPWTKVLEGKKVLVVHPFADSIKTQYLRHRSGDYLFKNPLTLPEFESLEVIQAIQSIGNSSGMLRFNDWFEALHRMEDEIDRKDYDVCLLGCGAYGFPLAAHVKRSGKKSVHLGGALQLLFGITGKRWELMPDYNQLMASNWIRPSGNEIIPSAINVEGGCYW